MNWNPLKTGEHVFVSIWRVGGQHFPLKLDCENLLYKTEVDN